MCWMARYRKRQGASRRFLGLELREQNSLNSSWPVVYSDREQNY